MVKTIFNIVAAGAFALAFNPAAHGAPALRFTAGADVVTVQDNGPGDSDPTVGSVAYIGPVGTSWTVNVSGRTKPAGSTATQPTFDLGDLVSRSTVAGTLIVEFSEDSFSPVNGVVTALIGGTIGDGAGSTFSYSTRVSDTNTKFGGVASLTDLGPYSKSTALPFSFSGTTAQPLVPAGAFAITQKLVITHKTGGGQSAANAGLTFAPAAPPPHLGKIGNFVWNDLTPNGIQEQGEPGINGVTVMLKDASNTVIDTTVTDLNGYYEFANLSAGSYTVTVDLGSAALTGFLASPTNVGPPDTDSNPNPATPVTLASDTSVDETIDFGFYQYVPPTGEIGDYVWLDTNQNGIQDTGEHGVPNVTVKLKKDNQLLQTTTTDADGNYLFSGLAGATYTVEVDTSTLPPGLIPTIPNATTPDIDSNPNPDLSVELPTDSSKNHTIDFGFIPAPAGSIGDYVWEDLDGDGIQGTPALEPGIPDVTVQLFDDQGHLLATTTTDIDGYYFFTGLSKGNFKVVVPPSLTLGGYLYHPTTTNSSDGTTASDSNPNPAEVTLPLNTSADTDTDFGYTPVPASRIGNFVWNDLNDNGVQDGGEPGIAGVTVNLYNPSDLIHPLATTTTDAGGFYAFTGLRSGNYYVGVDTASASLAGFIPTAIGAGAVDTDSNPNPAPAVLLTNTEVNETFDFGFVKPSGAIGDFVWNDLNFNGIQDNSEAGLNGVTVQLFDFTNALVATTTTSLNGGYLFSGLRKGTYTVVVDGAQLAAAGYLASPVNQGGDTARDSNPNSYAVNLASNIATDYTVDFGYFVPMGQIGDFVWLDTNQNGLQDPGELGFANVPVKLLNSTDVEIANTLTGSNGGYLFDHLPQGDYKVVVDNNALLLAGYIPTNTDIGLNDAIDSDVNPALINLPSNDSVNLTVDFGYVPVPNGSIGDFVWNDLNGNGVQDSGEPGIPGVTVRLTGTVSRTTITDAGGLYLFNDLPQGTYTVKVDGTTLPAGFIASPSSAGGNTSKDSNGNPASVSLANNTSSNMSIDFGYFKPKPLTIACPAGTATSGTPYSSSVVVSGGIQPYQFGITSGGLPPGLNLNPATGAITGTPTAAGSFAFTIQVIDAVAASASTSASACCGGGGTSAFSFNTAVGALGTSQVYQINGIPVTAYGFANDGTSKALYGTSSSGSDSGLGISGGSSGNEITTSNFVQLDLFNLITSHATNIQMVVNSVQSGDAYGIYGSNTLGSLGTLLGSANRTLAHTAFLVPGVPTYRYISVRASNTTANGCTYTKSDILLGSLSYNLSDCCVITVAPVVNTGKIGDFVWKDLNGNGIQDGGEPGINGVTVMLYNSANSLLDTEITSGNGGYLFTNLPAGTYIVKVDSSSSALSGRIPTAASVSGSTVVNDSNASPSTVTLATNSSSNLTIDFGYKAKPACGRICTYRDCGWGSRPWCSNRDADWSDCDDDDDRDWQCQDFNRRCDHERNYQQKCFDLLYPNGLMVGGACSLKFTSIRCIENFLPCSGTSGKLNQSYVNPTTRLGLLAGQVVALRLSVDFSNAGITADGLASAKFRSGKFAGKTVGYVLSLAESVLGGGSLPSGVSYTTLSDACALVNDNYDQNGDLGNLIP